MEDRTVCRRRCTVSGTQRVHVGCLLQMDELVCHCFTVPYFKCIIDISSVIYYLRTSVSLLITCLSTADYCRWLWTQRTITKSQLPITLLLLYLI